jgi:hypothetical protein
MGGITECRKKKQKCEEKLEAVLRILIRRIRMFLGLLDSVSDPLFRGMDPDPDPSITKQKKILRKTLSLLLCNFEK